MESGCIVFHADMDAFYAAVEEKDRPDLKGVPVVVGADPQGGRGRGVVCTANYPARAYGIRNALSISTAYRLAPHAVYLRPRFARYAEESRRVMAILRRYADVLEVVGLDEAYLDATGACGGDWDRAPGVARSLQAAVRREAGLSCSIGIAPNKAVAKVACNQVKPHGATLVRPCDVEPFLAPLPVRVLPGCGPKTSARLREMGIHTVAELRDAPPATLRRSFGSHADGLAALARGRDGRRVVADRGAAKSHSGETTFPRDVAAPGQVRRVARGLADELVAAGARPFATVTVKLRYGDFTTLTRAASFAAPLHPGDPEAATLVAHVVDRILVRLLDGRPVRLVGVRLSGFSTGPGQRTLAPYGGPAPSAASAAAAPLPPPAHGPRVPAGGFDSGGLRQPWLAVAATA